MARPRLDERKNKENTSIRLDPRDKEKLSNVFGSVQCGIDALIEVFNDFNKSDLKRLITLVRKARGE